MKKVVYFIFISLGVIATSCNYVSNPYPEQNANLGDTSTCGTPTFPTVINPRIKKILIEDFTGHTCGNCPLGALKLTYLDTTYPGHIIGMAEHVGSYAAPANGFNSSPAYAYPADLRCATGNDYETFFNPYAYGLPAGMINRRDHDAVNLSHFKFYGTQWTPLVSSIINDPSEVDLQIHIDYDLATRKICCGIRDSFLTNRTDSLRLAVVLVQDSIKSSSTEPNVGWQYNVTANDSSYVFNHVLRDAITPAGSWGELLTTGNTPVGTMHIKKFAYTIPASINNIICNPTHCRIIAYIYKTSDYEIIQSEEAKVIP